ncbi:MAG: cytochrome c biogenesis protein CcsA, partial [Campylobacterales bacterium]
AKESAPTRVLIKEGESKSPQGLSIAFKPNALSEIIVYKKDGELMIRGAATMSVLDMDTQEQKDIEPQTEIPFEKKKLYTSGDKQFVLQEYLESADTTYKSAPKSQSEEIPDLLKFKVEYNGDSKNIFVFGKKGAQTNFKTAQVGGLNIALGYGSKTITLPFALQLNDFILERYPGSMAPASYRSEVRVIDSPNKSFDYSIYMNHILEHKGYRFYQASYDMDEKGTILSVNHDYWGTLVTYIGYFLLSIGMLAAIFLPKGRILRLSSKIKSLKALFIATVALFALLQPNTLHAQTPEDILKAIDSVSLEHSKKLGKLLVQDVGGRVKPIETLAFEMVNKVHQDSSFHGLHPTQVLLGMLVRPDAWEKVKFISVKHPELREVLGLKESQKYAAFIDFFNTDGHGGGVYKIADILEKANQKRPAYQSKLDKEAIKADERLNITYMVYTGSILSIYPLPGDKAKKWFSPIEAIESFPKELSDKVKELTYGYFEAVEIGMNTGEWELADEALGRIDEFQRFYGVSIIPSEAKIDAEILYYNYNFFEMLMPIFGLLGFLLMIIGVINIIKPISKMHIILNSAKAVFIIAFIIQTFALGLRWYISGHAPWSNGYESMIYIAWASILAGLLLVRNNPLALGASAFLSAVVLFVAHLSWMDPQITNLIPVLNSYWLTIHVSVITASYGFFGLGALLGIITLILMALKRPSSKQKLEKSIAELTYINEITLIIGLVLFTIGNFLGGVWANESWGRYWGWDPKETWSLITIVVYAFVIHMRFIKGLYSFYTFNIGSIVAFFSVLMTYFGVNFYLSGLHSYAKGDPVPIPTFVYVMVAVLFLLIGLAYKNREQSIK